MNSKLLLRTRRTNQAGMTLIELLIVIACLLVLTAIAIPSLLASKRAANQSSAVQSLTTINKSLNTYLQEFPDGTNTGTSTTFAMASPFAALGGTAANCSAVPPVISVSAACLLDPVLATGTKDNYTFTMTITGPNQWTINADPASTDTTGSIKHFYTDNTNVIRYSVGAAATSASVPVGQ
jgi:type IV pilus assembly protein PilA